MTAAKISKTKPKFDLAPLPPEAATALQAQVVVLAAACEAGRDLESLKRLVTTNPQDPVWDLHLMAGLGNILHPLTPPLLASLFGEARDKTRRKALKRTLHLLQTRGLPVPPELLPREDPAFGKPHPALLQALITTVLGNGDSYLVLEGPKEILGGNFLVTRLNDDLGLMECHLLNLKSKQQPQFWDYYRQHGLSDWFPVPGPYAVRLLEEAYDRKTSEASARSTYGSLRGKILPNWGRPEDAPDLEQVLPVIEPAESRRLLEQSRRLAAHPLFQTWLPALEEITPWLARFQEVQESPLVLSDQQKQVRADALLDEATRALYPPETRPLWRRRLLTMAYYLDQAHQTEEVRLARAAAQDLADSERSSLTGDNPFLKSLVQVGLRLGWEHSRQPQEGQGESGLLTLPGDSPLIRR